MSKRTSRIAVGGIARRLLKWAPVALAVNVYAATGVTLPPWVCAQPDAIFVGGFEVAEIAIPHDPSFGSGGAYPGDQVRSVSVANYGTHNYYLHIPIGYTPARAWPLLIALEGSAGSQSAADSQAQIIRSQWAGITAADEYLVIVPVAGGAQGGWNPPNQNGQGPSDYDVVSAAIGDTESAYNIERTRRYAWGYSAGGVVSHDLILTGWSGIDANFFAAYAVVGAPLDRCPTYLSVQSCVPANAVRIIPLDIRVGNQDPLINEVVLDRTTFLNAGWVLNSTLYYTVYSGGHDYPIYVLSGAWANLCPNAVSANGGIFPKSRN